MGARRRPAGSRRASGAQPEWFYKGNGRIVVGLRPPIVAPDFALDYGEEPEIVGLYMIAADGTPARLGFAIGNEFSDHVTERRNYLYLAHSKLRQCAVGPELRTGELPPHLEGVSRIRRGETVRLGKAFVTGEANMCHSLANLEYHHFKYTAHRVPGDVHLHFFGTATISFADGIRVEPGDRFEIDLPAFGAPLVNPVCSAGGSPTPSFARDVSGRFEPHRGGLNETTGNSGRSTRLLIAAGCSLKQPESGADQAIVLGFSQIGAESEWRTANTDSIKSAAEKAGIELKFSDAQQKQENQIKAIRSFIAQRVDVIAFSPVVETGWETVLREAKAAEDPGDPDRPRGGRDATTRSTSRFIGSDFVEEGRKAGRWLLEKTTDGQGESTSSSCRARPARRRRTTARRASRKSSRADPSFKIIRSQTGDFTRAKGKEVMEAFLKAEGQEDQRAVRAQRRHGDRRDPGDRGGGPASRARTSSSSRSTRVKGAFEAMMAGKLNVTVECNPLLGPAAHDGGEGRGGAAGAAQAHRHGGGRLPDGSAAAKNSRRASTEVTRRG